MLNPKKGKCDQCGNEDYIVKKLPRGSFCKKCNDKRLEEKRGKKSAPTLQRKPTGEAEVFKAIWDTRKRVSFVSGENLGNDAKSWHFAHVIPKGKYPKFRLNSRNIVLLTFEEHEIWDDASKRKEVDDDPKWKKMFDLEKELKEEYGT